MFLAGAQELGYSTRTQFHANYPECVLDVLASDELTIPSDHTTLATELVLVPELFPLRRYVQFEDALNRVTADPLSGVLATLAQFGRDGIIGQIELVIRPASTRRTQRAQRCLERLNHPFFRARRPLAELYAESAMSRNVLRRLLARLLSVPARRDAAASTRGDLLNVTSSRLHDREEDLQAASDKLGRLLFEASLQLRVAVPTARKKEAAMRLDELVGALGQFQSPRTATLRRGRTSRELRGRRVFLLSAEEVATLFHPPNHTVRIPGLAQVDSRELAPPRRSTQPQTDTVVIGRTHFRSQRDVVVLAVDDRRRHLAIFGKTGTGKTTLLQNLLVADTRGGRGVALVDPHGDLADSLLKAVPRSRTNDVVVFDVGDTANPLSFNPLACGDPTKRPLIASGVVSAFKHIYGQVSWGPRLEHIFRNAALALLEIPESTLVHLLPLLTDERYRRSVIGRLRDPAVRRFWEVEFAGMPPRLRGEAIAPVLNKVGHFLSSPLLRHILGQSRRALNLREVMDGGAILIVNLSKGRIGEDASNLLGALLVTSLQLAAMSRADVAENNRRDFFAYVDEFSNFATDSFASSFSEARKYRLAITVATQYIEQLSEPMRASLFGNVGTLIAFQSSSQDAEILAAELGGELLPTDLTVLPKYRTYTRLLVDGVPSRPFSMQTLPPPTPAGNEQSPDVLRRTSRHRYAQPLAKVEGEIAAALA
ncbi:MAG: type IV secretory system conjugative DNA transfer family protein [Pirellulales bacterium]